MKYEIMQQQYVDFLNTLTTPQASNRYSASSTGYRYGITASSGVYSTTYPFVACNYLSWADLAAYLDWSGLRPMTELEYEKSCRGTISAISGELAWGSTSATQNTGIYRDGFYDETSSNSGNCTFGWPKPPVPGPMRVGAFATSSSTRVTSGATYYGIMEMSGNVWERPVTIGNVAGRSFTGLHGDGLLHATGNADVTNWPGTDAEGSGFRGGGCHDDGSGLPVSGRISAASTGNSREGVYGGRGVRAAP